MTAFRGWQLPYFQWLRCLWLCVAVMGHSVAYGAYHHDTLNQQWQQAMANAVPAVTGQYPYLNCFQQAANRYDLPLSLLLAVARGESSFNPNVVSKANAIGVMQIQWPGTAQHLGIHDKSALYNPCVNIDAGSRYLRELIDQFGSVHIALAAYNYGPGRIRRAGDQIPQGALWYSSYIYDHWQTVSRSSEVQSNPRSYKVELIRFREPFRAQGFVRNLQQRSPDTHFHWYKGSDTLFSVVAEFSDRQQAQSAALQLSKLGFEFAL